MAPGETCEAGLLVTAAGPSPPDRYTLALAGGHRPRSRAPVLTALTILSSMATVSRLGDSDVEAHGPGKQLSGGRASRELPLEPLLVSTNGRHSHTSRLVLSLHGQCEEEWGPCPGHTGLPRRALTAQPQAAPCRPGGPWPPQDLPSASVPLPGQARSGPGRGGSSTPHCGAKAGDVTSKSRSPPLTHPAMLPGPSSVKSSWTDRRGSLHPCVARGPGWQKQSDAKTTVCRSERASPERGSSRRGSPSGSCFSVSRPRPLRGAGAGAHPQGDRQRPPSSAVHAPGPGRPSRAPGPGRGSRGHVRSEPPRQPHLLRPLPGHPSP